MRVNVICRNFEADRVLPRYARYLADGLSWALTKSPVPADVHYLMGYFERQVCQTWPPGERVASLFTHREEQPPGNDKAKLFDAIARRVDLRVAMCRLYGRDLELYGPTIQPPLPVERDRFVLGDRPRRRRPLVGLSGFSYKNHRKGEDFVARIVRQAGGVDWIASGRGWPVPTKSYAWRDMPAFYQQLDVLVCPSMVEGGPMPVLEALACGTRVVVPRGVGILDELPDVEGIHRYRRGDAAGLLAALHAAAFPAAPADREALRATTAPFTVEAWCEGHRAGFAERFGGDR